MCTPQTSTAQHNHILLTACSQGLLASVTALRATLAGMDNMPQPPASGPHDNWPTQDFRAQDFRAQDFRAQDFGPQPGGQPQPPRPGHGRRSLRWSAGIALAALLAGGGAFAVAALTSSATPATTPTANSGQAVALDTILSSASSPSSAGSSAASSASAGIPGASSASSSGTASAAAADAAALSPNAAPAVVRSVATKCRRASRALRAAGRHRAARIVLRACRIRRLVRVRALGGLHGQFTVQTKSGIKTIGFARGVVESVTSSAVVIKSADNTLWTWDLVSTTVVRQSGGKVTTSALKAGQQVFAGGQVVSGANDARLIVIRPASASSTAQAPGSPTG